MDRPWAGSIETTERYTHVTLPALGRIKSPLDNMPLWKGRECDLPVC